jgi:threonine dehydrogenase-like Zn-dependent dehydrogenase
MKALCWFGKNDVRVEDVPEPKILNPRDCILKITRTAICGSDLHLYDGFIPTMQKGDILGHEFMGEVVETGLSRLRAATASSVRRVCGQRATTRTRTPGCRRRFTAFRARGFSVTRT